MTERKPTFLVIGAYKSGTTSLDRYLRTHPDVFVPAVKEPSHFAFVTGDRSRPVPRDAVVDPAAYRSLFAGAGAQRAVGEVSPEYLAHPAAAAAIADRLPDARLVAILRDPVERAYSDYLMYVRDGHERADFATAIAAQDERAARGDPTGFYVSTGRYGEQLARYYDRFPAEHIHVELFDDLVRDVRAVLGRVFAFLDVDPGHVPTDLGEHNVSGVPRSRAHASLLRIRARLGPVVKPLVPMAVRARIDRRLQQGLERPPMPDACRRRLADEYAEDVARAAALIGRDLSGWCRPPG